MNLSKGIACITLFTVPFFFAKDNSTLDKDLELDEYKLELIARDSAEKKGNEYRNRYFITVATQLGLDSMFTPSDSLKIRIWYDFPFVIHSKVLSLSYNHEWQATEHIGEIDLDVFKRTRRDSIKIINPVQRKVFPKHGWDHYIASLFGNKILTLPDMHTIPNLEDGWLDGNSYTVEILENNHYRRYYYHVPFNFQDFKEAKNMCNILEITQEELGVSWEQLFEKWD